MKKNIAFRMNHIKVEQFAVSNDKQTDPKRKYNIETAIRYEMMQESRQLGCQYKVQYINRGKVDLLIMISCDFEIEQTSWKNMITKSKLTVPSSFLKYMADQTIGTTRGILFEKTINTKFDQLILPPINLDEIIKTNLQFPLSAEEM